MESTSGNAVQRANPQVATATTSEAFSTTSGLSTKTPDSKTPINNIEGANAGNLIGEEQAQQQNDTIGFVSDGAVQRHEYVDPQVYGSLLDSCRLSDKEHDIQHYLARPIYLDTLVYDSQTPIGADLKNLAGEFGRIHIVEVLFGSETQKGKYPQAQPLREKLRGFYGLRGKFHLKLVMNAQPFQAGLFMMGYIPFYKGFELAYPVLDIQSPMSLPFSTGCPNKIINISQESEAEMAVPYMGPNVFLNLLDTDRDWGTFFFKSVTPPTSSVDSTKLEIAVYGWLTDVQLFGAGNPTFTAQSDTTTGIRAPTEMQEGQFSSALGDVSQVLQKIPLLNEVAPEVPMVLNGAKKAAQLIGLSKPTIQTPVTRLKQYPYGDPQHGDQHSTAKKLTLNSYQETTVKTLGPSEEDEMSVQKIVSEPGFLNYFKWSADDKQFKNIYYCFANPNCEMKNGKTMLVAPNRLFYLANHFQFWRGSIHFRIMFAANKFHTGRIRAVYNVNAAKNADGTYGYVYSQILDIRQSRIFDLECPFIAPTPWRRVPSNWRDDLSFVNDYDMVTGHHTENRLELYVEVPLLYGGQAASHVDGIVLAYGGKDFMVSAPRMRHAPWLGPHEPVEEKAPSGSEGREQPTIPNESVDHGSGYAFEDIEPREVSSSDPHCVPPPKEEVERMAARGWRLTRAIQVKGRSQSFKAQSMQEASVQRISMVGTTRTAEAKADLKAASVVNGEFVTNIRTLLKRYQWIGYRSSKENEVFALLPWLRGQSNSTDGWCHLFLDRLQALYRFHSGSRRVLIVRPSGSKVAMVHYNANIPKTLYKIEFVSTWGGVGVVRSKAFDAPIKPEDLLHNEDSLHLPVWLDVEGGVEVEIPFYSRWPMLVQGPFIPDKKAGQNIQYDDYNHWVAQGLIPDGTTMVSFWGPNEETRPTLFYQSVGDDFCLGYLLGPPMLLVEETE